MKVAKKGGGKPIRYLFSSARNHITEPSAFGELESDLGYIFLNKDVLARALTHSTYANELAQKYPNSGILDQETFSTLGDAILKAGFILLLMDRLSKKGAITVTKSEFENNVKLLEIGRRLKLKERNLIKVGGGKDNLWTTGEESVLSGTVEALFAAIFIDSGSSMGVVRNCISTVFRKELDAWKEKFPK